MVCPAPLITREIKGAPATKLHATTRILAIRAQASSGASLPVPVLAEARLLFATAAGAGHDAPGHAECAARVPAILAALRQRGLMNQPGVVEVSGFDPAPLELLLDVHDPRYIQALQRASAGAAGGAQMVDPSTYVTQSSYSDSLLAAGAVLCLVDNVVAASLQRQLDAAGSTSAPAPAPAAFAICRPPGHHAIPQSAMGFCLVNNAAVAARHAQRRHGLHRVAVFDWDVHHGNGTEAAFYADPSVLFISTHQAGAYPGTGKAGDAGLGDGEGYSINIPLPPGAGHEAALGAMEGVVEPALRRFAPDIILVSAGFDAHWQDPLADLQYRSSTYHELTVRMHALAAELCGGRLVFLLEGGYHLGALAESVGNTFAGICGTRTAEPVGFDPRALYEEPRQKVRAAIAEAQRVHGL